MIVSNKDSESTKNELKKAADNGVRHTGTWGPHLICCMVYRYLVTHLMGADLNNIVKCQKLTDDHVQFLIYQILRGLKVSEVYNVKPFLAQHWSSDGCCTCIGWFY